MSDVLFSLNKEAIIIHPIIYGYTRAASWMTQVQICRLTVETLPLGGLLSSIGNEEKSRQWADTFKKHFTCPAPASDHATKVLHTKKICACVYFQSTPCDLCFLHLEISVISVNFKIIYKK